MALKKKKTRNKFYIRHAKSFPCCLWHHYLPIVFMKSAHVKCTTWMKLTIRYFRLVVTMKPIEYSYEMVLLNLQFKESLLCFCLESLIRSLLGLFCLGNRPTDMLRSSGFLCFISRFVFNAMFLFFELKLS